MQDGNSKVKYLKARAELAEQAALKQNSLQHAAAQAPPCSGAAAWGPLPTCNYGCACPSCVLCFPALFSHYSLPLQIRDIHTRLDFGIGSDQELELLLVLPLCAVLAGPQVTSRRRR